jgi:hypothetical protein
MQPPEFRPRVLKLIGIEADYLNTSTNPSRAHPSHFPPVVRDVLGESTGPRSDL